MGRLDSRIGHVGLDFDPDLSPRDPINQEAARQRGLVYDPRERAYIDDEGCLIRDEFDQPF